MQNWSSVLVILNTIGFLKVIIHEIQYQNQYKSDWLDKFSFHLLNPSFTAGMFGGDTLVDFEVIT